MIRFLDALASPNTYLGQWLGQSVGEWIMLSDFWDSYRQRQKNHIVGIADRKLFARVNKIGPKTSQNIA